MKRRGYPIGIVDCLEGRPRHVVLDVVISCILSYALVIAVIVVPSPPRKPQPEKAKPAVAVAGGSSSYMVSSYSGGLLLEVRPKGNGRPCDSGMHDIPPYAPGVACIRNGITLAVVAEEMRIYREKQAVQSMNYNCDSSGNGVRTGYADCPVSKL